MWRPWFLSRPALAASGLALALLAPACAGGDAQAFTDFKALSTGVARPAAAAQGEAVAYLVASDGALVIRDRGGQEVPAAAGMPLLADDTLTPAKEALALVLLHNGYTVRVDGGVTLRIDDLAVFKSPPATQSIEEQLRASLSSEQQARLGDAGERIGGWQLRRTALDGLAPEEMPSAEPAAAPPPVTVEAEQDEDAPLGGLDPAKPQIELAQEHPAAEAPSKKDAPATDDGDGGGGAPPTGSGKGRTRSETPAAKTRSPSPSTPPPQDAAEPPGTAEESATQRGSSAPSGNAKASEPAPWRLQASTWTQGKGDPPAAALLTALGQCLSSRTGTSALVVLTVAADRATALTVDGVAHAACLKAVKAAAGLRGAGTLQVKLTR